MINTEFIIPARRGGKLQRMRAANFWANIGIERLRNRLMRERLAPSTEELLCSLKLNEQHRKLTPEEELYCINDVVLIEGVKV